MAEESFWTEGLGLNYWYFRRSSGDGTEVRPGKHHSHSMYFPYKLPDYGFGCEGKIDIYQDNQVLPYLKTMSWLHNTYNLNMHVQVQRDTNRLKTWTKDTFYDKEKLLSQLYYLLIDKAVYATRQKCIHGCTISALVLSGYVIEKVRVGEVPIGCFHSREDCDDPEFQKDPTDERLVLNRYVPDICRLYREIGDPYLSKDQGAGEKSTVFLEREAVCTRQTINRFGPAYADQVNRRASQRNHSQASDEPTRSFQHDSRNPPASWNSQVQPVFAPLAPSYANQQPPIGAYAPPPYYIGQPMGLPPPANGATPQIWCSTPSGANPQVWSAPPYGAPQDANAPAQAAAQQNMVGLSDQCIINVGEADVYPGNGEVFAANSAEQVQIEVPNGVQAEAASNQAQGEFYDIPLDGTENNDGVSCGIQNPAVTHSRQTQTQGVRPKTVSSAGTQHVPATPCNPPAQGVPMTQVVYAPMPYPQMTYIQPAPVYHGPSNPPIHIPINIHNYGQHGAPAARSMPPQQPPQTVAQATGTLCRPDFTIQPHIPPPATFHLEDETPPVRRRSRSSRQIVGTKSSRTSVKMQSSSTSIASKVHEVTNDMSATETYQVRQESIAPAANAQNQVAETCEIAQESVALPANAQNQVDETHTAGQEPVAPAANVPNQVAETCQTQESVALPANAQNQVDETHTAGQESVAPAANAQNQIAETCEIAQESVALPANAQNQVDETHTAGEESVAPAENVMQPSLTDDTESSELLSISWDSQKPVRKLSKTKRDQNYLARKAASKRDSSECSECSVIESEKEVVECSQTLIAKASVQRTQKTRINMASVEAPVPQVGSQVQLEDATISETTAEISKEADMGQKYIVDEESDETSVSEGDSSESSECSVIESGKEVIECTQTRIMMASFRRTQTHGMTSVQMASVQMTSVQAPVPQKGSKAQLALEFNGELDRSISGEATAEITKDATGKQKYIVDEGSDSSANEFSFPKAEKNESESTADIPAMIMMEQRIGNQISSEAEEQPRQKDHAPTEEIEHIPSEIEKNIKVTENKVQSDENDLSFGEKLQSPDRSASPTHRHPKSEEVQMEIGVSAENEKQDSLASEMQVDSDSDKTSESEVDITTVVKVDESESEQSTSISDQIKSVASSDDNSLDSEKSVATSSGSTSQLETKSETVDKSEVTTIGSQETSRRRKNLKKVSKSEDPIQPDFKLSEDEEISKTAKGTRVKPETGTQVESQSDLESSDSTTTAITSTDDQKTGKIKKYKAKKDKLHHITEDEEIDSKGKTAKGSGIKAKTETQVESQSDLESSDSTTTAISSTDDQKTGKIKKYKAKKDYFDQITDEAKRENKGKSKETKQLEKKTSNMYAVSSSSEESSTVTDIKTKKSRSQSRRRKQKDKEITEKDDEMQGKKTEPMLTDQTDHKTKEKADKRDEPPFDDLESITENESTKQIKKKSNLNKKSIKQYEDLDSVVDEKQTSVLSEIPLTDSMNGEKRNQHIPDGSIQLELQTNTSPVEEKSPNSSGESSSKEIKEADDSTVMEETEKEQTVILEYAENQDEFQFIDQEKSEEHIEYSSSPRTTEFVPTMVDEIDKEQSSSISSKSSILGEADFVPTPLDGTDKEDNNPIRVTKKSLIKICMKKPSASEIECLEKKVASDDSEGQTIDICLDPGAGEQRSCFESDMGEEAYNIARKASASQESLLAQIVECDEIKRENKDTILTEKFEIDEECISIQEPLSDESELENGEVKKNKRISKKNKTKIKSDKKQVLAGKPKKRKFEEKDVDGEEISEREIKEEKEFKLASVSATALDSNKAKKSKISEKSGKKKKAKDEKETDKNSKEVKEKKDKKFGLSMFIRKSKKSKDKSDIKEVISDIESKADEEDDKKAKKLEKKEKVSKDKKKDKGNKDEESAKKSKEKSFLGMMMKKTKEKKRKHSESEEEEIESEDEDVPAKKTKKEKESKKSKDSAKKAKSKKDKLKKEKKNKSERKTLGIAKFFKTTTKHKDESSSEIENEEAESDQKTERKSRNPMKKLLEKSKKNKKEQEEESHDGSSSSEDEDADAENKIEETEDEKDKKIEKVDQENKIVTTKPQKKHEKSKKTKKSKEKKEKKTERKSRNPMKKLLKKSKKNKKEQEESCDESTSSEDEDADAENKKTEDEKDKKIEKEDQKKTTKPQKKPEKSKRTKKSKEKKEKNKMEKLKSMTTGMAKLLKKAKKEKAEDSSDDESSSEIDAENEIEGDEENKMRKSRDKDIIKEKSEKSKLKKSKDKKKKSEESKKDKKRKEKNKRMKKKAEIKDQEHEEEASDNQEKSSIEEMRKRSREKIGTSEDATPVENLLNMKKKNKKDKVAITDEEKQKLKEMKEYEKINKKEDKKFRKAEKGLEARKKRQEKKRQEEIKNQERKAKKDKINELKANSKAIGQRRKKHIDMEKRAEKEEKRLQKKSIKLKEEAERAKIAHEKVTQKRLEKAKKEELKAEKKIKKQEERKRLSDLVERKMEEKRKGDIVQAYENSKKIYGPAMAAQFDYNLPADHITGTRIEVPKLTGPKPDPKAFDHFTTSQTHSPQASPAAQRKLGNITPKQSPHTMSQAPSPASGYITPKQSPRAMPKAPSPAPQKLPCRFDLFMKGHTSNPKPGETITNEPNKVSLKIWEKMTESEKMEHMRWGQTNYQNLPPPPEQVIEESPSPPHPFLQEPNPEIKQAFVEQAVEKPFEEEDPLYREPTHQQEEEEDPTVEKPAPDSSQQEPSIHSSDDETYLLEFKKKPKPPVKPPCSLSNYGVRDFSKDTRPYHEILHDILHGDEEKPYVPDRLIRKISGEVDPKPEVDSELEESIRERRHKRKERRKERKRQEEEEKRKQEKEKEKEKQQIESMRQSNREVLELINKKDRPYYVKTTEEAQKSKMKQAKPYISEQERLMREIEEEADRKEELERKAKQKAEIAKRAKPYYSENERMMREIEEEADRLEELERQAKEKIELAKRARERKPYISEQERMMREIEEEADRREAQADEDDEPNSWDAETETENETNKEKTTKTQQAQTDEDDEPNSWDAETETENETNKEKTDGIENNYNETKDDKKQEVVTSESSTCSISSSESNSWDSTSDEKKNEKFKLKAELEKFLAEKNALEAKKASQASFGGARPKTTVSTVTAEELQERREVNERIREKNIQKRMRREERRKLRSKKAKDMRMAGLLTIDEKLSIHTDDVELTGVEESSDEYDELKWDD